GGGRVVSISQRVDLAPVNFSFSDSRRNQSGALIRSSSALSKVYRFETTLSLAEGKNISRADFTVAMQRRSRDKLIVEALYGMRIINEISQRQFLRTQLSNSGKQYSWRAYVELYRLQDARNGVAVFSRWRKSFRSRLRLEFWGNLSRFGFSELKERRLYCYARLSAPLLGNDVDTQVLIATKLAYQYRHTRQSVSRVIARIELEASW
ncbi:hypothetical protein JYT16_01030, partial [Gemmatimonas aurantiaca]|nr:hypothetical protein [Gemmatimonas aurantiaca]